MTVYIVLKAALVIIAVIATFTIIGEVKEGRKK